MTSACFLFHHNQLESCRRLTVQLYAGALSQLLEDEFDFVRCAAARAVTALSRRSASIAETSLELLMSALFDDEPILRVAALAGIRVALSKVQSTPAQAQPSADGKGQKAKKAGGPQVPQDLYQAVRNCLEDSSMAVRLAAVRCVSYIV